MLSFFKFKVTIVNEQTMPTFERPIIPNGNLTTNDERKLVQLHCKEEIIKWLISVLQTDQPAMISTANSNSTLTTSSLNTHSSNPTESSFGYETTSNILSSNKTNYSDM